MKNIASVINISVLILSGVILTPACGQDSSAASPNQTAARQVTQGGPQDIAEFRSVLETGAIPSIELLDEVGFFAEHAVDLPEPDCEDPVCFHPMLAVAPRFDGGNWTMAFISANTSIMPEPPKSPRHLLLVIEHTPKTYETLPNFSILSKALRSHLSESDRVSVIIMSGAAPERSLVAGSADELDSVALPSEVALAEKATEDEAPGYAPQIQGRDLGYANLYHGLSDALALTRESAFSSYQQRVLVFANGATGPDTFEELATLMASEGTGISVFGMGPDYKSDIPRSLAEAGAGNYYYAEDSADLAKSVTVEAETRFVALAKNLTLRVKAQDGYRIGRIYAARQAEVARNEVTLSSPVLFVGARSGAADVKNGRRGGGGGWFVELLAEGDPGDNPRDAAKAFELEVRYEDAASERVFTASHMLNTPLGLGNNPPPEAPFFSHSEHAKPFMMLNMYLALRTAVGRYEAGTCGEARGVEEMMTQSYEYWKREYDDPDIDADFDLLKQLTQQIASRCEQQLTRPVEVPYSCFMF